MTSIYLDQNKWIKLARTYYKVETDELSKSILEKIEKLSNVNKIVIPFSIINFIETAKPEDSGRRERLAKFMYKLSMGNAILPFHSVRNYEFRNAITKKIGNGELIDISKIAISKNSLPYSLGNVLEIPADFKSYEDEILKATNSEETFVEMAVKLIDRSFINDIKQEDIDILNSFEEGRKKIIDKYDKETCLKIVIADMLSILTEPLVLTLRNMSINVEDFVKNLTKTPESILDFFFSIPTMDVWINLNAARDWDKDRKIDKNDMWDMGFLTMAIPYCDVVIAEKYFVNKAKELKFDEKYNTLISKDLEDLNSYLSEL